MSTVGYHGTKSENVSSIITNGFNPLIFGKNRLPNDLGKGVYFFLDSNFALSGKEMAKKYIEKFIKSSRRDNGASARVLEVTMIEDSELHILDLDGAITAFDQYRRDNDENISRIVREYKSKMGKNQGIIKRGNFDGIVTDMFIDYIKENSAEKFEIDAVKRETYTNVTDYGYRISNNSNGVELCVKNIKIIADISLVVWSLYGHLMLFYSIFYNCVL